MFQLSKTVLPRNFLDKYVYESITFNDIHSVVILFKWENFNRYDQSKLVFQRPQGFGRFQGPPNTRPSNFNRQPGPYINRPRFNPGNGNNQVF